MQVEAQDTSVIGQLGWPDMRLPLLYSLSWPHRVRMSYDKLDLAKLCEFIFPCVMYSKCILFERSSRLLPRFEDFTLQKTLFPALLLWSLVVLCVSGNFLVV